MGVGGSIPFIAEFLDAFPEASVLVTGVEDPDTRAHGANEGLHLAEFERVVLAEALLLRNLGPSELRPAGRNTRKVLPAPCSDSTSTRPSWRCTTRRTIASPRPVPGWAVAAGSAERKNSSNTRAWSSAEIPMPSSSRGQHRLVVQPVTDDDHGPARLGVLHRVADQVRDQVVELAGVAPRDHRLGRAAPSGSAIPRERRDRHVQLDDLRGERAEVDRARVDDGVRVRGAVQRQQVVDHPGQPLATALDRSHGGAGAVAQVRVAGQDLGVPEDRADRVLQVVGDGRDHPLAVLRDLAELPHELVLAHRPAQVARDVERGRGFVLAPLRAEPAAGQPHHADAVRSRADRHEQQRLHLDAGEELQHRLDLVRGQGAGHRPLRSEYGDALPLPGALGVAVDAERGPERESDGRPAVDVQRAVAAPSGPRNWTQSESARKPLTTSLPQVISTSSAESLPAAIRTISAAAFASRTCSASRSRSRVIRIAWVAWRAYASSIVRFSALGHQPVARQLHAEEPDEAPALVLERATSMSSRCQAPGGDVLARRVGGPAPLLDVEDQPVVRDELQRSPVVRDLQLVEERLRRARLSRSVCRASSGTDDHQRVQVAVVTSRGDAHQVESGDLGDALRDGLEGGTRLAVRPAGSADRTLEVCVVGHRARV